MSTFSRLRVQGFRRLADVEVELRPLCVAIGANGCGKTSLLDVFSLLAASAQGNFKKAINDLGGVGGLITRDRAKEIAIAIRADDVPGGPLDYEMQFAPSGSSYEITLERLIQTQQEQSRTLFDIKAGDASYNQSGGLLAEVLNQLADATGHLKPAWHRSHTETALSQVPKVIIEAEVIRWNLDSIASYRSISVEPRSPVRLPQHVWPASTPGRYGEDLVSCLYYLRETDRDRFETIEDTLKAAFRTFERLDFPPVAAGTLAMTWKDTNFSRPFYMHELGEGMLRFLWLATLLQSPGLTAVTLIDEPEISLHPELLSLLAGLLREASMRTQLIVATHSDRLVRFLEPSEVLAFDVEEDGTTKATWADSHDLDSWLAEYSLDEVWRLGRIGGRK
jgi:predicted ATPase